MDTARRFLVLTPVTFGVTAVGALLYVTVGAGLRPVEIGLGTLFAVAVAVVVTVAAAASLPAWLTFAVGPLVGDRRERRARSHAVSPTA